MRALFDTNILIDYLNGVHEARLELALYQDKAISIITWMEVQVGTGPADQSAVDQFLRRFTLVPIDSAVSAQAVAFRKATRLKLPDAIIWASACIEDRLLVTRNTKDFSVSDPGVRVPYAV